MTEAAEKAASSNVSLLQDIYKIAPKTNMPKISL